MVHPLVGVLEGVVVVLYVAEGGQMKVSLNLGVGEGVVTCPGLDLLQASLLAVLAFQLKQIKN